MSVEVKQVEVKQKSRPPQLWVAVHGSKNASKTVDAVRYFSVVPLWARHMSNKICQRLCDYARVANAALKVQQGAAREGPTIAANFVQGVGPLPIVALQLLHNVLEELKGIFEELYQLIDAAQPRMLSKLISWTRARLRPHPLPTQRVNTVMFAHDGDDCLRVQTAMDTAPSTDRLPTDDFLFHPKLRFMLLVSRHTLHHVVIDVSADTMASVRGSRNWTRLQRKVGMYAAYQRLCRGKNVRYLSGREPPLLQAQVEHVIFSPRPAVSAFEVFKNDNPDCKSPHKAWNKLQSSNDRTWHYVARRKQKESVALKEVTKSLTQHLKATPLKSKKLTVKEITGPLKKLTLEEITGSLKKLTRKEIIPSRVKLTEEEIDAAAHAIHDAGMCSFSDAMCV
jgi:hypothetical protein